MKKNNPFDDKSPKNPVFLVWKLENYPIFSYILKKYQFLIDVYSKMKISDVFC